MELRILRILKDTKRLTTKYFKTTVAMLLLVVMMLGYLPIEAFAQNTSISNASYISVEVGAIQEATATDEDKEPKETAEANPSEPIIITFMGEEVTISENYTVWVEPFDDGHLIEYYIGRYRHIDGERVRVDDPRIGSFSPVFGTPMSPLTTNARGQIIPTSGGLFPPVGSIMYLPQYWTAANSVHLQGNQVWARRYVVVVNGVEYEVFCADPLRGGPEDGTYNWNILGYDTAGRWLNALRYGFPRNPYLSDNFALPEAQRIQNAYITRVAVAMGRHSANQFTGNAGIINNASGLVNGTWPQNRTLPNAVLLNDLSDVSDLGREIASSEEWAVSERFYVSHNRVTNAPINPVMSDKIGTHYQSSTQTPEY